MRAIYAASTLALLAQPVFAAEVVRTYSLGCTNSSDRQWEETVAGMNRMFGDLGRFAFSRPDGTVTVTGQEDVHRHVAAMAGPFKNTCHEATVGYQFFALPADTDMGSVFTALANAGAVSMPPGSGTFAVSPDTRAAVLAKVAAFPGAKLVFSGQTNLLNHRSGVITQAAAGGGSGSVAVSVMIQGDDITIDTREDIERQAKTGTRIYRNGAHFSMASGDGRLSLSRHEDAVQLSVVTVDRSR